MDDFGANALDEILVFGWAEEVVNLLQHVEKDLIVTAKSQGLVGCVGADDVAVEVGLALVGNAETVGIFVGASRWEVVWPNVGVDGEFAEEWPHAACYARHAAERGKEHGFGTRMLVEGTVDAHLGAVELPIALLDALHGFVFVWKVQGERGV